MNAADAKVYATQNNDHHIISHHAITCPFKHIKKGILPPCQVCRGNLYVSRQCCHPEIAALPLVVCCPAQSPDKPIGEYPDKYE